MDSCNPAMALHSILSRVSWLLHVYFLTPSTLLAVEWALYMT